MLELEEALARILAVIPPLPIEFVSLAEAAGRFLGAPLTAPLDLPHFDNSAMDGYAVRAEDLADAPGSSPLTLRVIGPVAAGDSAGKIPVTAGTCVRIFTGSPLPSGADAVVMQEDTRPVVGEPSRVQVLDRVVSGENVRCRGEDITGGAQVMNAGDSLRPGAIALLAALGFGAVPVPRRPVVGLLAEPVDNPGDRRHFVRVTVDERGSVRLAGAQASHRLGALPRVNGSIDVPSHANWPGGTSVRVVRFE